MLDNHRQLATRLHAHGVAATPQRMQIAGVLLAQAQHMSAEQILAAVNKDGRRVSKATVYNTLRLFTEIGLIREVIVDPTRVFYDSTTGWHHHFYNLDTGELSDVPPGQVSFKELPKVPDGTQEAGVEVIIRLRNS